MSKTKEGRAFTPQFFKALCDSNRMNILQWLAKKNKSCCVGEISTCCQVDLSVVSRHLSQMKAAGFLTSERRGKEVFYRVNAKTIVHVLRSLADFLDGCCLTKKMKGGEKND